MKKKPKSIRIAEWNKTAKYINSKIEYYINLISALPSAVDETVLDSLQSNLIHWQNQLTAHISVKPI